MIKTVDFLPYAPLLEGQTARVNHTSSECSGSSASMVVTRTSEGVTAKCFRCGDWASTKDKGYRTPPAVPIEYLKPKTLPSIVPPEQWPIDAKEFFYRANIIPKDAYYTYGIGYSEGQRRIIMPVTTEGHVAGFVSRRVFDDDLRPRYLNHVFLPNQFHFWGALRKGAHSSVVIVVEDILSAIRVSQLGHFGAALLGTELKDYSFARLTKLKALDFHECLVWLDYDNPTVIQKQHKITRRLQLIYPRTNIVTVANDPKNFTEEELHNIIALI